MDGNKMDETIAVGKTFIQALTNRDFEGLQALFANPLRFRVLVPKGIREANQPLGAIAWYRRWFEEADYYEVQAESVDRVADRLSLNYRIELHDSGGWQVIEQKAFFRLEAGRIYDAAIVCSGFCPEIRPGSWQADAFYDAGSKGCAEGPLDQISGLVRELKPGQTLQVHASDPSVTADLPSWCRLAGHEFADQDEDTYLIHKKG